MGRGYQYSEKELLTDLAELREELGRRPKAPDLKVREDMASQATYTIRFGSWDQALAAAGIDTDFEAVESDEDEQLPSERQEELKQDIRTVAEKLEKPPTTSEITELGEYGIADYREAFGSWENALSAVGLEPRGRAFVSDQVLLEDLRSFAEYGPEGEVDVPRAEDMEAEGPRSSAAYKNRFGSWETALARAGLDPRHDTIVDDPLFDVMDLAESGTPPTVADIRRQGEFPLAVYRSLWGRWPAPLEAAAFDPPEDCEPPELYAASTLVYELRELATELGQPPTEDDVSDALEIPTEVFIDHFETWERALEAAGVVAPSEPDLEDRDPILSEGNVVVREATLEHDDGTTPLSVGEILVDEWSELVYRVQAIRVDVGEVVVEPEWIVVADLLHTEEPHLREFWRDEIEERLGDSIVRLEPLDQE